jgi:hypothetical protein
MEEQGLYSIILKRARGCPAKALHNEVLVQTFILLGTQTHSLSPQVTVPCTSVGAGGTMPVPTPTSTVCGTTVVTTGAATRTASTGLSSAVGHTL